MGENSAAFADLIAPVEVERFFAEIWEDRPFHVSRNDSAFYANLLTVADVERAISGGGLRYPAIQLARGGAFYPPEAFTRSLRAGEDVFAGVPIVERIDAAYRAGASISLPGFQRAWQPLGALVASLEAEFDHPVHANVYITPGGAAGFSPHYDTHEVFVLQIAGCKRWRISQSPTTLPHRSQPFRPQDVAGFEPALDITLQQGDLLYLPRGFTHTTNTAGEPSLHITIGVTVYTWVELLAEWAQSSRHNLAFRRALPPGFASRAELRQQTKETLVKMLALLQEETDSARMLDEFYQRLTTAQQSARRAFHFDVSVGGRR